MRERVVRLLREMSDAMRTGGDPTRARAYARAADNLEKRKDFDALYDQGRLQAVTGVGPSIERIVLAFLERDERPAWLDDPSRLPPPIGGARAGRDAAAAALADGYFEAPFPDLPDLHVHTTWSDGRLTVEEAVEWARRLGAPAVGISDHSGSLRIAHGLSAERVRRQWDEIDRVQARHPDVLVLKGTECDILRDGSLDHPRGILAGFDYVIGSLHSQLTLDRRSQTLRVLRALDTGDLTILGHPTTRVPGRRPRAALDLDLVFARAAQRGVAMEVNGNPGRLDLDAPLARRALAAGCRLACASDAHSAAEMVAFSTARRLAREAGATAADLVNGALLREARARRRGLATRP